MTVTPGTTILGSDFDALAGGIDGWFNSGCPSCAFGDPLQTYGWGGAASPARGSVMTAAIMNALVDRCNLAGDVIQSFSVSIPQFSAGGLSFASQYNQLESASNQISPIRLNIDPVELSLHAAASDSRSTIWGASDSTAINSILKYTWSSFDEARYFWNTGGAVNMNGQLLGGSTSGAANFVTLFASMGTVTMDRETTVQSGSGGLASPIGYYDLTTSWQQIFQQDIGGYGYGYSVTQQVTLYARRNSTGSYIEIDTVCEDFAVGTVDGLLTAAGQNRSLDSQASGAVTLTVTTPTPTIVDTFE